MNRSALGGFIALSVLLFSVAATSGQAQEVILIEDDFTNPAGDMPNEDEGDSPIGGDRTTLTCWWQSNRCCNNVFDGVTNLEMPFVGVWSSYIDSRQCGTELAGGVSYAYVAVFRKTQGGDFSVGFGSGGGWGANAGEEDRVRLVNLGPDGDISVHPGGVGHSDLSPIIDTGTDIQLGVIQSVGILIGEDGVVSVFFNSGEAKNWQFDGSAWVEITPSGIPAMPPGGNLIGANAANDNGSSDPFILDYIALVENPDMGPVPNEVMRWSLYD